MTYQDEVLADSPAVYWRFSEIAGSVAADSSGNGRDGGVVVSGMNQDLGSVLTDPGFLFDGVNDRVSTAAAENMASVTYEAIIKPTAMPSGDTVIVGRWSGPVQIVSLTIGPLGFPSLISGAGGGVVTGPASLVDDQPHHIVGTAESNGDLILYVDGVEVASSTSATSWFTDDIPLTAGGRTVDQNMFTGMIDEVAYYPNQVLSPARVAAHFVALTPVPIVNLTPPVIEDADGGEVQVGDTLTISAAGTWDPVPDSVTYQWRADGNLIYGATADSYVVTSGRVGQVITLDVTAHADGYLDAMASSNALGPVPAPPGGGGRCGCAGPSCDCSLVSTGALAIVGTGAPDDPWQFIADADIALAIIDTDTVDLVLTGSGTPTDPYVLSGTAEISVASATTYLGGTGGNYALPAGTSTYSIRVWAAGGGGGGGEVDAAGTERNGGGGGQGGAFSSGLIARNQLGGATNLIVSAGSSGIGGSGGASGGGGGVNGSAGGDSTVLVGTTVLIRADGGAGGASGGNGGTAGSGAVVGNIAPGRGGSGGVTLRTGIDSCTAGSGGGGGRGFDTLNNVRAAGTGGGQPCKVIATTAAGAAGTGGSGGGGGTTGAGGVGGFPAGGGGGGAANTTGTAGGAGANGGSGLIQIVAW